jgi:hypothetical protein
MFGSTTRINANRKPSGKAATPSSQGPFSPACSNPSFPQPSAKTSLGIDAQCGVAGSGGAEAEQNKAKNNFCASGTPESIVIDDLINLQKKVEQDNSINFGDKDATVIKAGKKVVIRKRGPTANRAPLQALGEGKLVVLKAFVFIARQENGETVNCGKNFPPGDIRNPLFHDIHISLVASDQTTNECDSVVAEMIPHHRPDDWTADNVLKVATAKAMVRVTGQLFFDSSHVPCANGARVGSNPSRVSLWEIHPIYVFEVCTADCSGAGQWLPLDQWAKQH